MMIRWVEANRIAMRCCIEGSGVPMVLVHQMGGAIESWSDVAPLLSQSFQVIRYDQRGAGMSEKPVAIRFEDHLDDIAGLLDALGISGRCHVVGPAFGSTIAWGFGLRYPDRVRTLALASPPGREGPPEQMLRRWAERAVEVERGGMRSIEMSFASSFPQGFRGKLFDAHRLRWLGNAPGAVAAANRMLAGMNHQDWCGDPACPVLMMGCSEDPFRPAADVRALAGAIPGAIYAELAAGHYPHLQCPEAFAQAVGRFAAAH